MSVLRSLFNAVYLLGSLLLLLAILFVWVASFLGWLPLWFVPAGCCN